jgi:hypothetical protein
MKRSEINRIYRQARACLERIGWILPPRPRWDITDFGLGKFSEAGLTLINLAEEPEYCEKLMYCLRHQATPMHSHRKKKEDIICRNGKLAIEVWAGDPRKTGRGAAFRIKRNGEYVEVPSGEVLSLAAGERVTLEPGVYHSFWAESDECVLGEVSTANDDLNDNFFVNPDVGRYPEIEEDEQPLVRLIRERS